MTVQSESKRIAGEELKIETGKMAKQANGSVTVQYGDTVLLVTATMSKKPKEGIDFFPLTIEFAEKYYASGKIPGGFFKREARPSTNATLTARLIDRPIRPCFPKHFYHDVQIIITVLSYDERYACDWLGIVGSSAALLVSDIPFKTPVGAALVCEVDGQLVVNPPVEDIERSTLEIVVSGTKDAVLMIESGAKEVSAEKILEAIQIAHQSIKETISIQEGLAQKASKPKIELAPQKDLSELESKIKQHLGTKIQDNMQSADKQSIEKFLAELEENVMETFVDEATSNQSEVKQVYAKVKKEQIRSIIIKNKIRPDGRALDQIRPISTEVGLLPSAHGSSLFTRGETQSLGVVTLGSSQDEQSEDGLGEAKSHSYYFHYNFPPFSVGECGRLATGRRELGHGALAQRAIQPILPKYDDFPYTIRLVSEILESNGSSSMASVCSGSLALMDCGVPTKTPVAGIAMGLLIDEDGDYVVLSDIQGLEDHYGDMDFKVSATKNGITALQLDIKVSGLSEEILRTAVAQAIKGVDHILGEMSKQIDTARTSLSPKAPQIEMIKIDPEKVGTLIGPGGKMIRKIEEETSATVFVVDGAKGEVSISAKSKEHMDKAKQMIKLVCEDLKQGDRLQGKVVKIVTFGAFLELMGTGKDALLHISKISDKRVQNVEDHLEVGQILDVRIDNIDQNGKVSLEIAK